jgi:hypothetical protein
MHSAWKLVQETESFISKSTKPWFKTLSINRLVMVSLNISTSGHISLKQSLEKQGILPSAVCVSRTETEEGIFWECPMLTKQRIELIHSQKIARRNYAIVGIIVKNAKFMGNQGTTKFLNDIPKHM